VNYLAAASETDPLGYLTEGSGFSSFVLDEDLIIRRHDEYQQAAKEHVPSPPWIRQERRRRRSLGVHLQPGRKCLRSTHVWVRTRQLPFPQGAAEFARQRDRDLDCAATGRLPPHAPE
jgi:hypothetical protein